MPKYRDDVNCDVCGGSITLPKARIEWNYREQGEMQVCHHECSHGWRNDSRSLSDMILDQCHTEQDVFERLGTIPEDYGEEYREACIRIRKQIFVI